MRRDDVLKLKYLSSIEFRVLTAVELGMRNHELVPERTVVMIANLRHGGVYKVLSELMQNRLVDSMNNQKHKGYRLTWLGYDFLALKALLNKDVFVSFGSKIAVGKESDIFNVCNNAGEDLVLKIHRLGRTSFRKVKEKRDYLGNRCTSSWLYLSRLSALKEYAFLKVLEEHGFPVPHAHGHSRHTVVMSYIKGTQLQQLYELKNVELLYQRLMRLIARLAEHGLIHCDFNEFNIVVRVEDESPVIIDFPQMVSTTHYNAQMYFERDVDCIRSFFSKRFRYESEEYPTFDEVVGSGASLDITAKASGYIPNKKELREAFESRFIIGGKKLEGEESSDEDDSEEDSEEDEETEEQEEEEELNQAFAKIDLRTEKKASLQDDSEPETEPKEDQEDSGNSSEEEESTSNTAATVEPGAVPNKSRKNMKDKLKRHYRQQKQAERRAKLKGEGGKKKKGRSDAAKDLKSCY